MGRPRKIDSEQYDYIVDLYSNGYSQEHIANLYGVSRWSIKQILQENNAKKQSRFSNDDIKEIEKLYNEGLSTINIGEIYGVSDETIRRLMIKFNIDRKHSKYTFNEHYFDAIDNQDKAYFVGLLYADGYNNVRYNTVTITLQESDKTVLEKINDLIESNRPLKFVDKKRENPNWKNCYQLSLTSEYFSKRCIELGIVARKSLILEFPDWLDKSLYQHWLRGLFDGDGHISRKQYKYNMSIISTEDVCNGIKDILYNEIGLNSRIYVSHELSKPTRTLMLTKKSDCKIFFDYIYNNANLYIDRKHNVYKQKYCSQNINNNLLDVAN